MKLTKSKLKQLIKEELKEAALNPLQPIYDTLHEIAIGLDDLRERVKNLEDR